MHASPTRNLLVLCGVIAPLIYFAMWAIATSVYPGYDHVTQYVSELGGPDAPNPGIFNVSVVIAGVLAVLGGVGFGWALKARGGGWVPSVLAGLLTAVFGVSFIFGGLFPIPDERHGAWGMGFAANVAPLFVLWALAREKDHGPFKAYLVVNFFAAAASLAIMFGVGELVTRANVGLWQRAFGLTMFPWMIFTGFLLLRPPAARDRGLGLYAPA